MASTPSSPEKSMQEARNVDTSGMTAQPAVSTKNTALYEFSNTEAMKEKVRAASLENKTKPYNVHDYYDDTGSIQWLARHEHFENFAMAMIVIDAVRLAFDTDGNTAVRIVDSKDWWLVGDVVFFFYFAGELCVRYCAFKVKKDCVQDGWFKLEFVLILLYACAFIIEGVRPYLWLRLLRLARLWKLVRMIRSVVELTNFMVMCKSMVSAAISVIYASVILVIITYVFSIAIRNTVPTGSSIETTYFENVPEAMHNLVIFGTSLDSVYKLFVAVKAESPLCLVFCWIYIVLAAFTVMNMLIGVLCQVISAVAAEESESTTVEKVFAKLSAIVAELLENFDGSLSWGDIQMILDHPEAVSTLESANIDVEGMVDVAEDYFFEDGKQVAVEFDKFVSMLLDLRGGQQSRIKDIMGLGKRVEGKFQEMTARMDGLEKQVLSALKA